MGRTMDIPAIRLDPPYVATARLVPEKRLMLAVLEDAIGLFCRHRHAQGRRRRRVAEAVIWLWSDSRDGPFAFVNVCEALGLDPLYVRAGLVRWTPDTGRPPMRRVIGRLGVTHVDPARRRRLRLDQLSHAAPMGAARPKGDAA